MPVKSIYCLVVGGMGRPMPHRSGDIQLQEWNTSVRVSASNTWSTCHIRWENGIRICLMSKLSHSEIRICSIYENWHQRISTVSINISPYIVNIQKYLHTNIPGNRAFLPSVSSPLLSSPLLSSPLLSYPLLSSPLLLNKSGVIMVLCALLGMMNCFLHMYWHLTEM